MIFPWLRLSGPKRKKREDRDCEAILIQGKVWTLRDCYEKQFLWFKNSFWIWKTRLTNVGLRTCFWEFVGKKNKFEMLSNVYKSYFKNIVSKCCKNHVFKMGFQTPIFLLNVTSRYIIMTFGLFDQKALLCTI